MAHSLSAKKRVRQNERRRARNRQRKTLVRDQIKVFSTALTAGDVKKSEEALRQAVVLLDRTAARNTIHKNTAARKRSRLTLRLNALKAGKTGGGAAAKTGGGKVGRGKTGAGTKAATA